MIDIYKKTITAIKQNPTVIILFMMLGLMDFFALIILFLSHSEPLSIVLAPIIRAFWGSRFLHYPDNFLLLPKLFNHAHLVILATAGILFSGIVTKKVEAYSNGKDIHTGQALVPVLKKYIVLVLAWGLTYFIYSLIIRKALPLFHLKSPWIQLLIGYVFGVVMQAAFAFIIPSLLLSEQGLWKDLMLGLKLGVKYLGITSLVIAFPILLIAVSSIFKMLTPYYVSFNPEIVLVVLGVSLVLSTVVDMVVTTSTVILFLKVRNQS